VLRKKLALLVTATMMLASMLAFASVASAVTYSSATATATASATSSASASAAGAAQYQYASALPGTGGVASPARLLAIVPAILLLGGGLLSAARLLRRS
jgi:guanyl-specific ribonuclease Sa